MRFIVSSVAGLFIGAFMVWLMFVLENAYLLLYSVHLPAFGMVKAWVAMNLPSPHGDMALMLFPIFTFVQWLLTGIIVGIVLQLKHHRKRAFDKVLTSADELDCSTFGSNRPSGHMPMKYESKFLSIVVLLETGVVILAYLFAWSFFSVVNFSFNIIFEE